MQEIRKTKIVATLGPASNSREVIAELVSAGLNVARLNFSHGTTESHGALLKVIREESLRLGQVVGVLQDLSGPKLRIGEITGDSIQLVPSQRVRIYHARDLENSVFNNTDGWSGVALTVSAFNPQDSIHEDDRILLADGRVELVCREVCKSCIEAEVVCGGSLRSHAGVNLPDSDLQLAAVTEKDLRDLRWGIEHGVDYVALSYVSSPDDIVKVKEFIAAQEGMCKVIAKIERRAAVERCAEILKVADGIMIARGDLGLEIPLEDVPHVQRELIALARAAGKPVITATQLLLSLVTEVRPTRAEVSDVYTAVMEGTDAVMLSEETAIGRFPVRVLQILNRILRKAEEDIDWKVPNRSDSEQISNIIDSVAYATQQAGDKLGAGAIIVCTESGYSAKLLSYYRARSLVYVWTESLTVAQELSLFWGLNFISNGPHYKTGNQNKEQFQEILSSLWTSEHRPVVVLRGKNICQAEATMEVYTEC